jgi:hypothetical protein
LLHKPKARIEIKGSTCQVLFNYFKPLNTIGKYKYNHVDPQWIDIESVISTIDLTIDPNKPDIYILGSHDIDKLNEFINSYRQ